MSFDKGRWPSRVAEGGVEIPPTKPDEEDRFRWADGVLIQPAATWTNWACHMRCGLHSGFPRCCIRYWAQVWSVQPGIERYVHACAMVAAERYHGQGYNYIPCPKCVYELRRPFQIYKCPADSPCGRRMAAHKAEMVARHTRYQQTYPNGDSLGMLRQFMTGVR